jgi:hypothetical protein
MIRHNDFRTVDEKTMFLMMDAATQLQNAILVKMHKRVCTRTVSGENLEVPFSRQCRRVCCGGCSHPIMTASNGSLAYTENGNVK